MTAHVSHDIPLTKVLRSAFGKLPLPWRAVSRILTFTRDLAAHLNCSKPFRQNITWRQTPKFSWLNYSKCMACSKENWNFQLETVQLTWLASSPPEWVRSMDSLWFPQHELLHRTDHELHGMEPENMVCNVTHRSIEYKLAYSKIMSFTSTSCRFSAILTRSCHRWNSPTDWSCLEYWEI